MIRRCFLNKGTINPVLIRYLFCLTIFISFGSVFAQDTDDLTFEEYMEQGEIAYQQKDYTQASLAYTAAINLSEESEEAYLGRAMALYWQPGNSDLPQVQADLERVIELNPESAIAYAYMGNVLTSLEDDQGALEAANYAIDLAPTLPEAFRSRGRTYLNRGEYDLALEDLDHAIELDPEYVHSYRTRSSVFSELGDYDAALSDLEKVIELDPEFVEAYTDRVSIYLAQGDFDRAVEDVNYLIELDPNDPLNYIGRAHLSLDRGDYDFALEDLNHALELDDQLDLVYPAFGRYYNTIENYAQAVIEFDKALELNPDDADVHYDRSYALYFLGETTLAIDGLSRAIEIDESQIGWYDVRGTLYREQFQYEAAIADFTIVIDNLPDYTDGYINRGIAYLDSGQYVKAIADFNKAIELDYDPLDLPYHNLGLAYNKMGLHLEAIEAYTHLIELTPESQVGYILRANVFTNAKLYKDAIEDAEKAIELAPDDPRTYTARGYAYLERGLDTNSKNDLTTAIAAYNIYIELVEDTPDVAIVEAIQIAEAAIEHLDEQASSAKEILGFIAIFVIGIAIVQFIARAIMGYGKTTDSRYDRRY